MRGGKGVVQPDGEHSFGEEKKEGIEKILIDTDEETTLEIVIMVSIVNTSEPFDCGLGSAEE